jgi:hypothetical protein
MGRPQSYERHADPLPRLSAVIAWQLRDGSLEVRQRDRLEVRVRDGKVPCLRCGLNVAA